MISLSDLSNSALLLCKYNNIINHTQSQVVFYEKDNYISSDLFEHINSLNETGKLILEHMIRKLSRYDIGYFSQESIARETGTCRKTVNKYCKLFHLWGIITKQKRFEKTCLYKISDYLLYEEIIKMLASLIGAFSELLETAVTGIRNLYYISTKYLNPEPNFEDEDFKNSHKGENIEDRKAHSPIFFKKYHTNYQDNAQDCTRSTTKLEPNLDIWRYFEVEPPTIQKRDDEMDFYAKVWPCNRY